MNPFIWRVEAQVDGVASPTIPYVPPGDTPQFTPTPVTNGPSISVFSDKATIAPGETANISVRIDTKGQTISEYRVELLFTPQVINIVDSQPIDAEIQVTSLDNDFTILNNQVSQSTGIISFSAKSESGVLSLTDKPIFEFQVTGGENGFSEIKVDTQQSNIIGSNTRNILEDSNDVSITVDGNAVINTAVPTQPIQPTDPNAIVTQPVNQTPVATTIPVPTGTPNTAITDSPTTIISILFSFLSIALGSYIYKSRKRNAVE